MKTPFRKYQEVLEDVNKWNLCFIFLFFLIKLLCYFYNIRKPSGLEVSGKILGEKNPPRQQHTW